MTAKMIQDDQVEGFLFFIRDVTERRRRQEKLAQLHHKEKELREQICPLGAGLFRKIVVAKLRIPILEQQSRRS